MTRPSLAAGLAVLLATSLASAQESDADEPSAEKADDAKPATAAAATPSAPEHEAGEDATYGHGMQFGIRAGLVAGYLMDFRYDHSPLCKAFDAAKPVNEQQKICGFGAPAATEIALSFAPLDGIEPYVFGRFGFSGESDTNTNALMLVGVGARLYTMADSRLKVFIEPAVAYETESGAGNPAWSPAGLSPEYKKDLVFHVGVGPQYDFAKAFGAFLNAGIDVGVLRSISAVALINLGVQLRFP